MNGSIPKSFGQLSNLEVLNVSDNKLGGMVSELHFANLRHLTGTDIVFKFFCYRFRPTWVPPFQLQGIGMSISVSTMASKFKHKRMLEFYKCLMPVYWFEEISSGIFRVNLSHDHIRKCLPKLRKSLIAIGRNKYLNGNKFERPLATFSLDVVVLSFQ